MMIGNDEDIVDDNDDCEPLTPADHGKVPGSGNTVVPVPGLGSKYYFFYLLPLEKYLENKVKVLIKPPGIVKGVRAM